MLPSLSTICIHKGKSRHRRGSFNPQTATPLQSGAMTSRIRARQRSAALVSNHPGGNGLGSCQERPKSASNSSWALTTSVGSQYPWGLSWSGGIWSPGNRTPSILHTRISEDVALRCMPVTSKALDVDVCRRLSAMLLIIFSILACSVRLQTVYNRWTTQSLLTSMTSSTLEKRVECKARWFILFCMGLPVSFFSVMT